MNLRDIDWGDVPELLLAGSVILTPIIIVGIICYTIYKIAGLFA